MAIPKLTVGTEGAVSNSRGSNLKTLTDALIDLVEDANHGNAALKTKLDELKAAVDKPGFSGIFNDTVERDAEMTAPEAGQWVIQRDTRVIYEYTGADWVELLISGSKVPRVTELLEMAANNEIELTYIVTGDSHRDNNQSVLQSYYTNLFGQINVTTVNNAASGQSAKRWKDNDDNGGTGSTLSQAIAATPGTGETTVLEFSLGANDTGDVKAELKAAISAYMTAKPDATVVLVSSHNTTGAYPALNTAIKELAEEFNLHFVNPTPAMAEVLTDPEYMTDVSHLNNYGSRRLLHVILDQLVGPRARAAIRIPDLGEPEPPENGIVVTVESGYYDSTTGNAAVAATWRRSQKFDVEPNFTLAFTHMGERTTVVWYDGNGDVLSVGDTVFHANDTRKAVVPLGAFQASFNITSDGGTWDALAFTPTVEYLMLESRYMSPLEISKGIGLPFELQVNQDRATESQIGKLNQVLTSDIDGKRRWCDSVIYSTDAPTGTPPLGLMVYVHELLDGSTQTYIVANGQYQSVSKDTANKASMLFDKQADEDIGLTYIVSGDSNRDNNFNNMISYYNTLLSQINVSVVGNASSGQSGEDWLNNDSSAGGTTLQQAIDATPGTGETTLLEYSFGPNDSGTNSEIKAVIKGGIEAYLAAKPDATVVMCSPVRTSGKYGTLIGIYEEVSSELRLQLVKPHPVIEPYDNDPNFKQDTAHLNAYGSQRLLHFILSNIVSEKVRSSISIPDLGVPTAPSTSLSVVVKPNYWSQTSGLEQTDSNWRSVEKIPVEPNYKINIYHGGSSSTVVWYDGNGDFMSKTSSSVVSGDVRQVTVPVGAFEMGFNVDGGGSTWDALNITPTAEYVIEPVVYMSPEEVNVGMVHGFPRFDTKLVDSYGKTGSVGQVLVPEGGGRYKWATPIVVSDTAPTGTPADGEMVYHHVDGNTVNTYVNLNGVYVPSV